MTEANRKKKKKKGGKVFYNLAILILCGCVIVFGIDYYNKIKVEKMSEKLKDIFYNGGSFSSENFGDLLDINPDAIGWLTVPNTECDLVVVQSKDNTYYMDKDFFGEPSKAGTLFLDYRNKTGKNGSDNLVIYGHNQQDLTMMGDLKKYKNIEFYKENPVITFTTESGTDEYKVFAFFVTNADPKDGELFNYHNYINFENEKSFNEFINETNARSYINSGIDIKYGDKFITLSTCSTEFENSRFVVFARKIRSNESSEIDISLVKKNSNIKRPDIWHKLYG